MRLMVFFDHIFVRDAAGRVYTRLTFTHSFWERYLQVFDEVTVVSRVRDVTALPEGVSPADGPRIRFHPLPTFIGPWEYLLSRRSVRRAVARAVGEAEAVILRVPSTIGTLAWRMLRSAGRPFAVEVVADPAETLGPGTARSLLRPIARLSQARAQRIQCREADAAAYVSKSALQLRYPPGKPENSTYYSSIDLASADVLARPREFESGGHRLVHVGTFETLYKGQDVLLHALAGCARNDLRITFVGDGRRRAEIEQLARDLNLAHRVSFAGRLTAGPAVFNALDASDLFVLPSRTEGLPKAMIEAMARGLPCIGTRVGGIPELLGPEWLVPANDPRALADRIVAVLSAPDRMRAASRENLHSARQYTTDVLNERRVAFYRKVAACTRSPLSPAPATPSTP